MKSSSDKRIERKILSDTITKSILLLITLICASVILIIIGIIFTKGISPFFNKYMIDGKMQSISFWKFISGMSWERGATDYGVLFIIINTVYVVFLSLLIAVPISVLTALFIVRIAPRWLSKLLSSTVELLASIPSIIFGLFGAGLVAVGVREIASLFGKQTAGGLSVLATVIVLAMMIMPTITMISITSIKAVRDDVIKGALALGASVTQTNFKVVLISAKSGIFSGIILGTGRALGEATAVSMVAGGIDFGPSFNIFNATRTLTSTMLTGFNEATGIKYDIRFALAIILIVVILGMNIVLNLIKRKIENR